MNGDFTSIDLHFSRLMCRLAGSDDERLGPVFARLSRALASQHSCLDLSGTEDKAGLLDLLHSLPVTSGDGSTPLVVEGERLYMQRYHYYETRIASRLTAMNQWLTGKPPAPDAIRQAIAASGVSAIGQQVAVTCAISRRLAIITGGPGTGKTTTVAGIISALGNAGRENAMEVRLAAPTGKAAMRLRESLADSLPTAMPEVTTLHRLLGVLPGGRGFRYHAGNPLSIDLLVVDEVSMIDLAMMHRLLSALPSQAQLILLGDPDQLPSVEAGNILGDICKYPAGYSVDFAQLVQESVGTALPATTGSHLLCNAICELHQSFRFADDRGIGKLSAHIRAGTMWQASERTEDEVLVASLQALDDSVLVDCFAEWLTALDDSVEPEALLAAFEQARILTPVREGDFGVVALNDRIERRLAIEGRIDPGSRFYHGRPILVTRNDYNLQLFNGDVGICINLEGQDPLVVFRNARGEIRTYLASRLPPHETCFAMTVHKSQGSEFERVLMVLAPATTIATQGLLTREMLYTAVTRARSHLSLYCEQQQLDDCLANRSERQSGLGERFIGD